MNTEHDEGRADHERDQMLDERSAMQSPYEIRQKLAKATQEQERLRRECAQLVIARDMLADELHNIASATPQKWEMNAREFDAEFRYWAQNRARHALASVKGGSNE